MIRVTAFRWVPPSVQGLVRDLPVRWALEEAGLEYEERLVSIEESKQRDHRSRQPFGQVPVLEDDGLVLFESGAIVLHIAEKAGVLLPVDAAARARVRQWMFAALNSIEQHIQALTEIDLFHADKAWAKERRPGVLALLQTRLGELATTLGERDYLEGDFSVADLMMTSVLRIPRHVDVLAGYPTLAAYVRRCESRPAFRKALADQLRPFAANAPAAA